VRATSLKEKWSQDPATNSCRQNGHATNGVRPEQFSLANHRGAHSGPSPKQRFDVLDLDAQGRDGVGKGGVMPLVSPGFAVISRATIEPYVRSRRDLRPNRMNCIGLLRQLANKIGRRGLYTGDNQHGQALFERKVNQICAVSMSVPQVRRTPIASGSGDFENPLHRLCL
jgi:hypothetical protein